MKPELIISPIVAQLFYQNDLFGFMKELLMLFIWGVATVGPICVIHFLFTLPMRRRERSRLFLDLLEGALKRGQPSEEMVLSLVQNRDRSLGMRFHFLAAYIENGARFNEALKKVPLFLPPQIFQMLQAGEKFGDIRRVLPACREILRDHPPGVRSAIHYLLLVVFLFSPVFFVVVIFTMLYVVPRFKEVAAGMDIRLWPETLFVFDHSSWLIGVEAIIFCFLIMATGLYLGGPGFSRILQSNGLPLVDWIAWHVPWKQKRLQRTFSAMLAVLLDGGVPEAEAIRLAGDCTANETCRRKAARIIAALQQGVKLDDAVRLFDESGEFHWRLTNTAHGRGGFLNALRGWHEALDAMAFQQEEGTAHIVTSGIVIVNGLLVGLIVTAMFGILLDLLNAAVSAL